MNTTDSNTTATPARSLWSRQDWDTLLELLQLLVALYALFLAHQ